MTAARRILIALGAVVMAFALVGALRDHDVKFGVLLFLAGVLVAHDGILVPIVIGLGFLLGRVLPVGTRPVVRGAAIVSVAVTLVALPLVLGFGRPADNPSVLPLQYGRGLVMLLIGVWAAAGASVAVRAWRRRKRPTGPVP